MGFREITFAFIARQKERQADRHGIIGSKQFEHTTSRKTRDRAFGNRFAAA
jgi:hypothetical protein